MKKLKKIMFILISISLFKTTAFATKENPNKINIIEDEKLDKDEKIKNVYGNIKCDVIKNTKTLNMKNSKNINNTENISLFNPKNKLIFNKNLETDINLSENKKEENPNKINIIEDEKDDKIQKVYDNIKCDVIKNTKTLNMKNSKNINNTENISLFNPKNKLIFNKNLETDINLSEDKKEENPNKINIIEEEKSEKLENNGDKINIINEIKNKEEKNLTKEELEIKIKTFLTNFEELKKKNNFDNILKALEEIQKLSKDILDTFLDFNNKCYFFKISWDNQNLLNFEETLIKTLYPLLIKDDICIIYETLRNFTKQKEFENIDENLGKAVIDALKSCIKFNYCLTYITSKFDKIFADIPYEIVDIPPEKKYNELEKLNKKSKIKKNENEILNIIFKEEIEILNKKQPLIGSLKDNIKYFNDIYKRFIKTNFNYKITESAREHLMYLDKILDIELVAKKYFNSLKDLLGKTKNFSCSAKENNTINTADNSFSNLETISENIKSMINTLNTLIINSINLNDIKENPIISSKDKILNTIDEFFYFFEKNKTKNFIENNKILENVDFYKKMFSEISKYKGETINESGEFKNQLRNYIKNIREFKKEHYNPYIMAKQKIINLDLKEEYEQELNRVEKIFRDADLLEGFFSSYLEMMNNLVDKSKMKILNYNYLNISVERWNILAKILDYNKKMIENFISPLEKNKEISSLEENKNAYIYYYNLANEVNEKIVLTNLCIDDLKTFYDLHIADSKEKEDYGNADSLIEQFKEIKRNYQEKYNHFKNTKNTLETFLKTILTKMWNSLEPILKKSKEETKNLISYLEENKEKIKNSISSIEKDKTAYKYISDIVINVKEKIIITNFGMENLEDFCDLDSRNSNKKENNSKNSLIEQFKEIKRNDREEYYNYFKNAKNTLETFLKTIPIKID